MSLIHKRGPSQLCLVCQQFFKYELYFLSDIVSVGDTTDCVLGLGVILWICRNCCNIVHVDVAHAFVNACFKMLTKHTVCSFDRKKY